MIRSRDSRAGEFLKPDTGKSTTRILGAYGHAAARPLVIAIAGLHGNEPSGIMAVDRVLTWLQRQRPSIAGRIVALLGNVAARRENRRFISSDMNRMWSSHHLQQLLGTDPARDTIEQREQRELLSHVEAELAAQPREVTFLDLHSTSAPGAPFSIISDTLQNRQLAFSWPMPVIIGLEEAIQGTIQEYFGELGYVTCAVEGGEHNDPVTADRLEAAVWIALVTSGLLRPSQVPHLAACHKRLRDAARGLPSVVGVFHRHGVAIEHHFRMRDGFQNFSPVREGQTLAEDRRGEIHALAEGILILPNYQNVGDDGFFLGRRVRRFWLRLSTVARKIRLGDVLPVLPGIHRHPQEPRAMLVNPKIARWLVLDLFHLFGYRKCPMQNGYLVFRRRRENVRDF